MWWVDLIFNTDNGGTLPLLVSSYRKPERIVLVTRKTEGGKCMSTIRGCLNHFTAYVQVPKVSPLTLSRVR